MASSILLESRPYRPFKSSEEYLEAMREDLAEWLNTMYPEVMINSDNFMDCLDTGVVLCKHANNVRQAAEDYLVRRQTRNKSMLRSMTSGLAGPILAMGNVYYLPTAKSGTFFARDNVSNFITWCRKALKIFECLLFETDDLIMRKNEKHVILCLLEVARLGVKFGMLAPMLIQMERQIDREIAADNKANGTDCDIRNVNNVLTSYELDTDSENEDDENPMLVYGPQPQIITNDLKSLDEMVRDLLEKCTCPSQFPMIRVSEGKYRIGDTKILIFVRILRSHVMVRVGGGWDTLSHYLDKHDPCRCKSQHRSSVAAKLIPRTNNQTNGIELHHAQVIFERSTPMTTNVISNSSEDTGNNQHSISSLASFTTKGKNCSPVPPRKDNLLSSPHKKLADNSNSASPRGRHKNITSSTKQLSNTVQKQLSSELETELPVHFGNLNLNKQSDNGQDAIDQDTTTTINLTTDNKFENISDNSSEISDEGYRSLGIANFTNYQQQKHGTVYNQALSIDDPEGENTYHSRDLSCQELQSKTQNQLDDFISKMAVGDDKMKVDIAASTGLRKTNFSDKIYGVTKNGENIKIQPDKSVKKKTSKIPQSPVIVRKHGNANCKNDLKVQSNVTLNSCQQHENKAYFKENQGKSTISSNSGIYHRSVSNFETVPFRKNANTWSGGRSKTTKKRSAITEESFVPPTSDNNSRGRSLVVLYDSNNRRIRGGSSSLTTSPVKNMSSPLKQQLLRTAERAKSDVQILEKMKGLLNEYSDFLDNAEKTKSNEKCDLTTAWVHNNGTFNRSDTCLGRFKNSSVSSSMENTFIKNNSTSDIANARKDRGLSKIPTRIRNHTQLY